MIPQEYRDFGMVDIPHDRPACFRVWSSPGEFTTVPIAGEIQDVYWSGNSIIAIFENHKRIYYGISPHEYETIYL